MKGVIISGHGEFAHGMNSLVTGIMGEMEQYAIVPFGFNDNSDVLEQQLRAAITQVDSGDGVIMCTDTLGGTPFFRSSKIVMEQAGKHLVFAGCNFTTIAAALSLRESTLTTDELEQAILTEGINGLSTLNREIAKSRPSVVENGI